MRVHRQPRQKHAMFKGRLTRRQYWHSVYFNHMVGLALAVLVVIAQTETFVALFFLFMFEMFVTGIPATVRRLHDMGLSGGWYVLSFLPIIGSFILFVIYIYPSDEDNKFGPAPLPASD